MENNACQIYDFAKGEILQEFLLFLLTGFRAIVLCNVSVFSCFSGPVHSDKPFLFFFSHVGLLYLLSLFSINMVFSRVVIDHYPKKRNN
uniref:Uncharacterized protein n=1 Tax=Arundo donax TaxID=35708 RepID=A0A0A8YFL2_ARUDO